MIRIPDNIFEAQPKHRFSKPSLSRLRSCDYRLELICRFLANYQNIRVLCGWRSEEDQNKAVAEGVSRVAWPNSKHNVIPSIAVDIAPWPIDWDDLGRFRVMAGRFLQIADMLEIRIRWGGDWDRDTFTRDQKFQDLPHFELVDKDPPAAHLVSVTAEAVHIKYGKYSIQ